MTEKDSNPDSNKKAGEWKVIDFHSPAFLLDQNLIFFS